MASRNQQRRRNQPGILRPVGGGRAGESQRVYVRESQTRGLRGAGLRSQAPPTHPTLPSPVSGDRWPVSSKPHEASLQRTDLVTCARVAPMAPFCLEGDVRACHSAERVRSQRFPAPSRSSLAPARSAGAGRVSGARWPWAGRQSVVPGVSGRVRRSPALAPRLSVSRRCRLAGPAPVCRARPGRGSLTAIQHQTAQGTFRDVLLLFFHFTRFSGIASSVLKPRWFENKSWRRQGRRQHRMHSLPRDSPKFHLDFSPLLSHTFRTAQITW